MCVRTCVHVCMFYLIRYCCSLLLMLLLLLFCDIINSTKIMILTISCLFGQSTIVHVYVFFSCQAFFSLIDGN